MTTLLAPGPTMTPLSSRPERPARAARAAGAERAGRAGRRDEGVRAHYDLSNAFYALWLGPTMTYSAARWAPGTTSLEQAQQEKLELLGSYAGIGHRPVRSVLDIGCGWGGMLEHARTRGVAHTVGITLSAEQARWIESRGGGHDVRVTDWRALDLRAGSMDAIVSIGCFEHIAEVGASAAGRAATYAGFFDRCAAWLADDGRLALQTITTGDARLSRSQQRDVLFLLREIFPFSRLPSLPEILGAAEGRLELLACRNDRMDYVRTLQAWHERAIANRARTVELVGAAVADRYERYLRVSAELFEAGAMNLCRFSFRTPGGCGGAVS